MIVIRPIEKLLPLLLCGLLGLAACGDKTKPDDDGDQTLLTPYEGIWQQVGYGHIWELKAGSFVKYEISSQHCLVKERGALRLLEGETEIVEGDATQFSLLTVFGGTWYHFDRIQALPELCADGGVSASQDPELNFEILWHTFNEQYAFFEKRGVDWQTQYETYRPRVTALTTQEELFEIFKAMVEPLKDGHVGLLRGENDYYHQIDTPLFYRLQQEFSEQSEYGRFDAFLAKQLEAAWQVTASYLQAEPEIDANNKLRWGSLNEDTGYLFIEALAEFSGAQTMKTQIADLDTALDKVFLDFKDKQQLVIDLRANTGGWDSAAVALASRLVAESRLGFTKQARADNGFTPIQEFQLEPVSDAQGRFLGPIVILTSGITASAAENLLLNLLEREQVTLVGQSTSGIFSDALGRHLPNGWQFGLSNEIFRGVDGKSYEAVGFQPSVELDFLSLEDRQAGKDSMMEYLLQLE